MSDIKNGKLSGKISDVVSLLLNLLIVVLGTYGTIITWNRVHMGMFQYYTVLSNIFGVLACATLAVFLVIKLATNRQIPKIVYMIKYLAVCCLTVTLIVVITVLAPMRGEGGYEYLLTKDDMLFHHLLCPLISIVSFVIFDKLPLKTVKSALLAILPTAVYGLVAIVLNIAHIIVGPYPFLRVYNQSVLASVMWFIAIFAMAFLIAFLIALTKYRRKN